MPLFLLYPPAKALSLPRSLQHLPCSGSAHTLLPGWIRAVLSLWISPLFKSPFYLINTKQFLVWFFLLLSMWYNGRGLKDEKQKSLLTLHSVKSDLTEPISRLQHSSEGRKTGCRGRHLINCEEPHKLWLSASLLFLAIYSFFTTFILKIPNRKTAGVWTPPSMNGLYPVPDHVLEIKHFKNRLL